MARLRSRPAFLAALAVLGAALPLSHLAAVRAGHLFPAAGTGL